MNEKTKTLSTKPKLKAEQDIIAIFQMFDLSYFFYKNYLENDRTQNYLVFQSIYCCFKKIGNSKHIPAWKSKVLPDKSIKSPTTSNNSLSPALIYISGKIRVKHAGSCWKLTFNHKTLVNIYIVYEINLRPFKQSARFTSREFLFGAVNLTEIADFYKYKYSGYGPGFDSHGSFSLSSGSGFGKNIIMFDADMSSSAHADNKDKDILILDKGPLQDLDEATLNAEKEHVINFSEQEN